jgi:hypothetical protein
MSRKYYNHKTIDAGQGRTIKLATQDTSYGFRHIAEFYDANNYMIGYAKKCYYNRTWESYDYQTVIHAVIDAGSVDDPQALKEVIDMQERDKIDREFGMLGAILAVGDIIGETPGESADFKLRMLRARFGEGLTVPEDWETLSDEVKNDRLNKIQASFLEVSNE